MRLDAEYYISKTLIPPLERIFNLVGANVRSWYENMPKIHSRIQNEQLNIRDLSRRRTHEATLHTFVQSRICAVCEETTTDDGHAVCHICRHDPVRSVYSISARSRASEVHHIELQTICSDCCNIPLGDEVACDSRDCPAFYSRLKAKSVLEHTLLLRSQLLERVEND